MGLRQKKNQLVQLVRIRAHGKLTPEQQAQFELLYRRARTPEQQAQVTKALHDVLHGWKGAWEQLLRNLQDDPFADEDEDPPALREALARAAVPPEKR